MTVVSVRNVRGWSPTLFDDIAPGVAVTLSTTGDCLTFAADLTPAQVADVRWRMCSRDDAHEARLRALAGLREALALDPSLKNTAALAVALADETLGEVP